MIKGKDKKSPYLGTLRFRYMLPVPQACLKILIRDDLPSPEQRERVRKELAFCRKNKDKIYKQAEKTYNRVVNQVEEELVRNSCDFKLLESACLEWMASKEQSLPAQAEQQPTAQVSGSGVSVPYKSHQNIFIAINQPNSQHGQKKPTLSDITTNAMRQLQQNNAILQSVNQQQTNSNTSPADTDEP